MLFQMSGLGRPSPGGGLVYETDGDARRLIVTHRGRLLLLKLFIFYKLLNTILRSLKSPVVNLTQSVFANDDVLLKNYTPAAEILVEDSCE